jgi:hypothetical protein
MRLENYEADLRSRLWSEGSESNRFKERRVEPELSILLLDLRCESPVPLTCQSKREALQSPFDRLTG